MTKYLLKKVKKQKQKKHFFIHACKLIDRLLDEGEKKHHISTVVFASCHSYSFGSPKAGNSIKVRVRVDKLSDGGGGGAGRGERCGVLRCPFLEITLFACNCLATIDV